MSINSFRYDAVFNSFLENQLFQLKTNPTWRNVFINGEVVVSLDRWKDESPVNESAHDIWEVLQLNRDVIIKCHWIMNLWHLNNPTQSVVHEIKIKVSDIFSDGIKHDFMLFWVMDIPFWNKHYLEKWLFYFNTLSSLTLNEYRLLHDVSRNWFKGSSQKIESVEEIKEKEEKFRREKKEVLLHDINLANWVWGWIDLF